MSRYPTLHHSQICSRPFRNFHPCAPIPTPSSPLQDRFAVYYAIPRPLIYGALPQRENTLSVQGTRSDIKRRLPLYPSSPTLYSGNTSLPPWVHIFRSSKSTSRMCISMFVKTLVVGGNNNSLPLSSVQQFLSERCRDMMKSHVNDETDT